jgi:hypothetical protein
VLSQKADGIGYEVYQIQSQSDVSLGVYLIRKAGVKPRQVVLHIADASFPGAVQDIQRMLDSQSEIRDPQLATMIRDVKAHDTAYAIFYPRGIGPTAWSGGPPRETQLRRRYMLIGQTLDGMRVWDICRAIEALRSIKSIRNVPLTVEGSGDMGVDALYASLFAPGINDLHLEHMAASQMDGPDYLNVLKILDIPEAAAMAAERCPLQIQSNQADGWEFLKAMADCPVAEVKVKWDN